MKPRATSLQVATIAALLAVGAVAPNTARSATSEAAGPQISDCRVGFRGEYKAGFWTPIWVEVRGRGPESTRVEVTTIDSDGVPTVVAADVSPASATATATSTTVLYAKIGRQDSPVRVSLMKGDAVLDRVTLKPGPVVGDDRILPGLPATSELLVAFGSTPIDLAKALGNRDAGGGELARRIVHLDQVAELPTEWYGYSAVDTLVLSASDVALFQSLAADTTRLAALTEWVELGGRLVLLCGQNAPELIGPSGPLADLVPGRLIDVVELTQTSELEQFAQSDVPILTRHSTIDLPVARLADVTGRIAAFAGRQPADLPLVVQAPRGLGVVVFAGLDLDQPPLAEWRGRPALLRTLAELGTTQLEDGLRPSPTLATFGYNDLAGALRQRLGRSFPSVTTMSFSTVALLAIGYLLVLGPLDYFVIHKLLGRPMLAWVTFPLIVLVTSGGAFWLAEGNRGDRRVNQLELVDVDLTTGRARGTYWATLYSPRSQRYDLALTVRLLGRELPEQPQTLLSNLGLPGTGVGGTQAVSRDWEISGTDYRLTDQLSTMAGVPIQVSSTKSLVGRWLAAVGPLVQSQLTADPDGLVEGTLENTSGAAWADGILLYGGWAYRLGNVADGTRVEVGQQLDPVRARALLARQARGRSGGGADGTGRGVFQADEASLAQVLQVMMFYEMIGGYGFAGLPSRYEAFCDLSDLLNLGRAILVVRVDGPGSELVDRQSNVPLGDETDSRLVVYRFVLPVAEENGDAQ
jgi:hypothetical protein